MQNLPTVLIIDDEKDFRDIAVARLTSRGFAVKTAANSKEGIELARTIKPDLILMDVQMPDKDGIQATIEMHSDPQTTGIPIIFLTNLGDNWPSVAEINRKFAKEIGAMDYFKKSGDYDTLVEKIREALAKPTATNTGITYKR
ncbi:MAG: response regulator [bacterium]|nr:response regulator [bacterium]